jgi:hypothetical protein
LHCLQPEINTRIVIHKALAGRNLTDAKRTHMKRKNGYPTSLWSLYDEEHELTIESNKSPSHI